MTPRTVLVVLVTLAGALVGVRASNAVTLVGSAERAPSINFRIGAERQFSISMSQNSEDLALGNANRTLVLVQDRQLVLESRRAEFRTLAFSGEFIFRDKKQFTLLVHENFAAPEGWSSNEVSSCGAVQMLGGYGKFAGGEVRKQFAQLPPHQKLRIVANFHFIDGWVG